MNRLTRALQTGAIAVLVPIVSAAAVAIRPEAIPDIPRGGATATAPAVRVDPPVPTTPTVPGTPVGHFTTLVPGSALPTDAACRARVRPSAERRTINTPYNQTRGVISANGPPPVVGQPITGDFTGTTDEILQWVACKWGIDEDIVRAQIVKESYWHQDRANSSGDRTNNPNDCHPSLRTPLPCPESIGLGQVRFQAHRAAFENENAIRSSAYNLDYTYSVWRSCYEGQLTWLNQVEHGATYAAGDVWGCTGVWFSGRWYVDTASYDALDYIRDVQAILAERTWETPNFQVG